MGEYSLTFPHTSKSNFQIVQNTRLPLMEYFGSDGKFNRHTYSQQNNNINALHFIGHFTNPHPLFVGLCGYLVSVNKEVMTKS